MSAGLSVKCQCELVRHAKHLGLASPRTCMELERRGAEALGGSQEDKVLLREAKSHRMTLREVYYRAQIASNLNLSLTHA